MLYDFVEVAAIKIAVGNMEVFGGNCKDILLKSIDWLIVYYENTNEKMYLEKAMWHAYAYSELGFGYEEGKEQFEKVMTKLNMDVFGRRKFEKSFYKKVKLTRSSVNSLLGRWNPKLHSMKIDDAVTDIIAKASTGKQGEYLYHSGKVIEQRDGKELWEKTYKLFVRESEAVLYHINANKYYIFLTKE